MKRYRIEMRWKNNEWRTFGFASWFIRAVSEDAAMTLAKHEPAYTSKLDTYDTVQLKAFKW